MLNHMLENDIRNSGQGALSAAKCYRTHWRMHEQYDSFQWLNKAILEFAKKFPLASRTDEKGNPEDIPIKVLESWGFLLTIFAYLLASLFGLDTLDKASIKVEKQAFN